MKTALILAGAIALMLISMESPVSGGPITLPSKVLGCQMAIARFSDRMCLKNSIGQQGNTRSVMGWIRSPHQSSEIVFCHNLIISLYI